MVCWNHRNSNRIWFVCVLLVLGVIYNNKMVAKGREIMVGLETKKAKGPGVRHGIKHKGKGN